MMGMSEMSQEPTRGEEKNSHGLGNGALSANPLGPSETEMLLSGSMQVRVLTPREERCVYNTRILLGASDFHSSSSL